MRHHRREMELRPRGEVKEVGEEEEEEEEDHSNLLGPMKGWRLLVFCFIRFIDLRRNVNVDDSFDLGLSSPRFNIFWPLFSSF